MKVKELIKLLQDYDQDSEVVIAGYETICSAYVAEADLVKACKTVQRRSPDSLDGNKELTNEGDPSVWIGWSGDYRTPQQLAAIEDPDEMKDQPWLTMP
nr:hypothetical protein [Providencia sp. PROV021]